MRIPFRTSKNVLALGLPAALALYLVVVCRVGLSAKFAADDMMNLGTYLQRGWEQVAQGLALFWSTFYRPMGGVFYLSLYEWFGLNPLPYRVVIYVIGLANGLMVYRVARLLTGSRLTAWLAAMACGYHGHQPDIHYNTSSVYDVLCFFFYIAALLCYLEARAQGRVLTKARLVAVIALYLCALNSKEMAVSFPVAILAYEGFYHVKTLLRRQVTIPLALFVGITLIFVIGKTQGPGALTKMPAYRPVVTAGHYLERSAQYTNEAFYTTVFTKWNLFAFWAVWVYLAWRRPRPHLRFAWIFALASPLPIAFIPGRGWGAAYIPLLGFSLLGATLAHDAARFLSKEVLFRWVRLPRGFARVLMVGVASLVLSQRALSMGAEYTAALIESQNLTWTSIKEIEAFRLKVPRNGRVVFLKDPFEGFDIVFITWLVLNDPSIEVVQERRVGRTLTEEELAAAQAVLTFENGHYRRIR
ncbi:MAG: hypothetical protein ACKV22_08275 [Bryobacteraceae bacterium]